MIEKNFSVLSMNGIRTGSDRHKKRGSGRYCYCSDAAAVETPGQAETEDGMKSLLIKDTTKEEREAIVRQSLDCGGGCENCSSCWLGGGNPFDIYQPYIDGEKELSEINAAARAGFVRG